MLTLASQIFKSWRPGDIPVPCSHTDISYLMLVSSPWLLLCPDALVLCVFFHCRKPTCRKPKEKGRDVKKYQPLSVFDSMGRSHKPLNNAGCTPRIPLSPSPPFFLSTCLFPALFFLCRLSSSRTANSLSYLSSLTSLPDFLPPCRTCPVRLSCPPDALGALTPAVPSSAVSVSKMSSFLPSTPPLPPSLLLLFSKKRVNIVS